MANIKEIDWTLIQQEYVMSNSFPSYDDLSKKYTVSKPLIIAIANDRNNDLNNGKTWIELRADFRESKAGKNDSEEETERKLQNKKSVSSLRKIQDMMYEILNSDLEQIINLQEDGKNTGVRLDISKFFKINDFVKLTETIDILNKPEQRAKQQINVSFHGKETKKLEDMTDEELKQLEFQVETEVDG